MTFTGMGHWVKLRNPSMPATSVLSTIFSGGNGGISRFLSWTDRLPPFELPFSDPGGRLRKPGRDQRLSWRSLIRLKGGLSNQPQGIVIKVHIFLQWNQNVDAVLEFAVGDLRSIQKSPVEEETFDHPRPDILNKLIDHLVEDRAFVGVAGEESHGDAETKTPFPLGVQKRNHL